LGLGFGSFANVCIYRIPRGESIIEPRSHCPSCGKQIKWYDNIPLISYAVLGGRCRYCRRRISLQYPLTELISGFIFLFTYQRFRGAPLTIVIFLLLAFFLVIVSEIDLKTYTIPNIFTYPLILLGLFSSPFNSFLKQHSGIIISSSKELTFILSSFQGVIAGGGILYLIALLGRGMFKREAMGWGDIELVSAVGAFLGAVNVLWVIFLASLLGAITGGVLIITGKYKKFQQIPFGIYISLGTVSVFLFQPIFNQIYLDLISICR
jgi:leader peptidase (prepilin peptidase)/N-methyltransferase